MASTLCLGPDHQPQSEASPRVYRERKARLDDNSFFNLFGAGNCFGDKVERSRTRRPLPVNTLTGQIIGSYGGLDTLRPAQSPTRGEFSSLTLTSTEDNIFRAKTSRRGTLSSLVSCGAPLAFISDRNKVLAFWSEKVDPSFPLVG